MALDKMLSDNHLREEFRLRGLRRAEMFSWKRTARQTLEILEKVST
jgi:glycosyltransferase involved in cell wall biosynthesis